jgi:hypothetical protein
MLHKGRAGEMLKSAAGRPRTENLLSPSVCYLVFEGDRGILVISFRLLQLLTSDDAVAAPQLACRGFNAKHDCQSVAASWLTALCRSCSWSAAERQLDLH